MKKIVQKNLIYITILMFFCFLQLNELVAQTPFWKSTFDYNDFTDNWSVVKLGAGNLSIDNWTWTDIGPQGPNKSSIGKLKAASKSDGWAIFDTDNICLGKVGPNYNEQHVALFSPEISTLNKGTIWLKVDLLYKKYYDSVYVIVEKKLATGSKFQNFRLLRQKIDNNQFTDCTLLSPNLAENPHTQYVDLSTFAANSKIKIGFAYISNGKTGKLKEYGCGYAVQLDDVELFDINPTPNNDLKVKTNFFAIPTNAFTPKCQTEPLRFLVDVTNIGKSTQSNVAISTIITKVVNGNSFDTIFKKSFNIGSLKPDSLAQNIILPFSFDNIGDYGGGQYDLWYLVGNAQKDDNPRNNALKYTFYLSESYFVKDNGSNVLRFELTEPGSNSPNWTIANHFHIVRGKDVFAKKVNIPLVNAKGLGNRKIAVGLFEWQNKNDLYEATEDELTQIATGEYYLKGTETDCSIVIENLQNPNANIELKDNTDYLLVMDYIGKTSDTKTLEIYGDNTDYAATSYIYEQFNQTRMGSLRYNKVDNTFSSISGIVASLRLLIDEDKICNIVANDDAQVIDIQLFPNPSQGIIELSDIENIESISIFNELSLVQNIKTISKNIDCSQLENGLYFIEIELKNKQKIVKKQLILH
jgi:hypothetical protein